MKDNETKLSAEGTAFIQKAQIKCPKCTAVFLIPEPQVPRDVRCGKCKFTFQVGIEKISVVVSGGTRDNLSKETVASGPIKKAAAETVDVANKTMAVNSDQILNETLLPGESQSLRNFLKIKGLTPKAILSHSTTFDSDDDSTKYIYGKEIGRGGMGAIISTHDMDTRRNIVTKVLLRTASKKALLRFIEEAQITAQLEHPNIVPIYDIGVNNEGNIYYTMQHVKGDSLQTIIEKSENQNLGKGFEYSLSRFLQILVDVSNAVAFAHSKKVIHRDLKPDNIMLGEYGEVILMDFGLAKILTNESPEEVEELIDVVTSTRTDINEMLTLEGDIAGTPKYMAPEQANGDIKGQDEQTDIYALGAILFACIAKKPPIPGNSVHEVLQNVIEGRRHPLPESTPREIVAIINKAMAVEKTNRYSSVKEFSNDIKLYMQGYSISAKEDSIGEVCIKLIKRNKQIFLISLIAFSLFIIFGLLAIQKIIQKKEEAENNLNKFMTAQKIAEQEKLGKEKLQNEKVKTWKPFYEEKFDLKYHVIPDRPIDYGFGNWGVYKGRMNNESNENWNELSKFAHKVWFNNNEIHFSSPKNGYLYLNKEIYGNIRFETTVAFISGKEPEITVFMYGSKENQELDGYTLAFGEMLKFQKKGKTIHLQKLPEPIIKKEMQHILFERTGNVFKFYLNNMLTPIFQWEDSEPINGEKNTICGFYVWDGEISIKNVSITKQAWAKQNAPIDFVDRLRKLGQDKLALEEYKEIIFSSDDPQERSDALFEMATTYKKLKMRDEATAILSFFTNKSKNENIFKDIVFVKSDNLVKKSFAFLFLIALDDYLANKYDGKGQGSIDQNREFKLFLENCKNHDSLNFAYNHILAKTISNDFSKENYREVIRILKLILQSMNKESLTIYNNSFSEFLYSLSLNYCNMTDYALADYLLTEAIGLNDKDDKLFSQRGYIRRVFSKDEETKKNSLKDSYQAMELNPNNKYGYINIVLLYWENNQQEKAIEYLLTSIKKSPNSIDLHNRLAGFYLDLKKYELFEETIKKANLLSPNHPSTNYWVGIYYLYQQKLDELEKFLSKENGKEFNSKEYLHLTGLLFHQKKQYKEATNALEELVRQSSNSFGLDLLAEIYFETGEFQKTVDAINRLSEKYPLDEFFVELLKKAKEKIKEK